MDDSRIFIVGARGQLGKALKAIYPSSKTADVGELDITDLDSVANYDWSSIDYVLNAAAYTKVDEAEVAQGRVAAWNVNASAVGNLVRACQKNHMTLVHISTDYVFDGTKSPHSETESYSPLGVYAQTKAAGDIAASTLDQNYILRTSWVIGDGPNFVRTMLGVGKKSVEPTVVADQIGRLTFTSELARAIDHLLTNKCEYGTYNLSNDGEPASWADITREIFKNAGYDLTVTNTTTEEYFAGKTDVAPRPLQSTLALDKIKAIGFSPRDWHENLADYIKKELETA